MLGEPPDLVPPINPGLKDGVLVKIVLTQAERIILGLRLLFDPAVERVVPYSGQRARTILGAERISDDGVGVWLGSGRAETHDPIRSP
jgi:hypothetical protein